MNFPLSVVGNFSFGLLEQVLSFCSNEKREPVFGFSLLATLSHVEILFQSLFGLVLLCGRCREFLLQAAVEFDEVS